MKFVDSATVVCVFLTNRGERPGLIPIAHMMVHILEEFTHSKCEIMILFH